MNDKILTLLGFASKSGKLSYGFDAVKTALSQKKSKLVLIANDVSQKSKKEIGMPRKQIHPVIRFSTERKRIYLTEKLLV